MATRTLHLMLACAALACAALACKSEGESNTDGGTGGTDDTDGTAVPAAPELELGVGPIKQFNLSWEPVTSATFYRVFERADPTAAWTELASELVSEGMALTVPLHLRAHAAYAVSACNSAGCTQSEAVDVTGDLAEAIGYVKPLQSAAGLLFGEYIDLSDDGSTLAVGVPYAIAGQPADLCNRVIVYRQDGTTWHPEAELTPPDDDSVHAFGTVALSASGDRLVVGDWRAENDTFSASTGAAYVFVRDDAGTWTQEAELRAEVGDDQDRFGVKVAMSYDGTHVLVGADGEDGASLGLGGDPNNDAAADAGAAYLFELGASGWQQLEYIKPSNSEAGDGFGRDLDISGDGQTIVVFAPFEDGAGMGTTGDPLDNSLLDVGAVYVFSDAEGGWQQSAYLKSLDEFGFSQAQLGLSSDGATLLVGPMLTLFERDGEGVWTAEALDQLAFRMALSGDARVLAIGDIGDSSAAIGIDGDSTDLSAFRAGAVRVLVRNEGTQWLPVSYVKAPNTDADDAFGLAVALSGDGATMAVGAASESSAALGVGGDSTDNSVWQAGAIYLY